MKDLKDTVWTDMIDLIEGELVKEKRQIQKVREERGRQSWGKDTAGRKGYPAIVC